MYTIYFIRSRLILMIITLYFGPSNIKLIQYNHRNNYFLFRNVDLYYNTDIVLFDVTYANVILATFHQNKTGKRLILLIRYTCVMLCLVCVIFLM